MSEAIIDTYWARIAARHDEEAFAAIDAAYREPQRAYHAWGHIVDLLKKLDGLPHLAARPDLIATAIFWHDSVYLTRDPDGRARADAENVRASAELFARHSKFDPIEAQAIHDMIMATASHMKAKATTEHYPGFGQDLELLLDLDLSSLAAPWPVFEKNLDAIHFEFGWESDETFYEGRVKMLETFLGGGERLYRLPQTRALWLAAARENLLRVDAELRNRLVSSHPA
jgi:predicted metal-dependent HD superfamily phosphohydrolase